MEGLHYVFIFYAAVIGFAALLSLGVGNTSLLPKKTLESSIESNEEDMGGTQDSEATEALGEEEARATESALSPQKEKARSQI